MLSFWRVKGMYTTQETNANATLAFVFAPDLSSIAGWLGHLRARVRASMH